MNVYIQLLSVLTIVMLTTSSYAVIMQYSFNGLITLEKLGGGHLNPIDQSLYKDLSFNITITADTDNIQTRNLAGLGTNYYVDGITGTIVVDNIGNLEFISPRMSAIPGVGVAGLSWGNNYNISRGSASFSGANSFLTKEIFDDTVFLRQDWFNDEFNNPFLHFPNESYEVVDFSNVTYSVSSIPLPPSIYMLSTGLFFMYRLSKKRQKI